MTLREIIETEKQYKFFKAPFGIVTVTSERNMYVVLNKKYTKLAEDASDHFLKLYDEYNSWEDICNKVEEDFLKAIMPAIEAIKQDFISVGVYDIDYPEIFQKISDMGFLDPFVETYDKIMEKIYSIMGDVEANRQYREARKENRGRWQVATIGGDFIDAGINQMKTNTMNAASGVAHSIVNNYANKRDRAKAERLLEELFEDESLGYKLAYAVDVCVRQFKYSIFSLIMDYGLEIYMSFPTQEDVQKGERLFKNLQSGSIPEEDKMSVLEEIFECLCFDAPFYVYLLYSYANYTEEIAEMIAYFGVDIKPALDRSLKLIYDNCEKDSIEQLGQMEAEILKIMECCHIKKLKTYNKIVSQKEKLIDEYLKELYENGRKETEKEVLALQEKIDDYMKENNIENSKVKDEVVQRLNEVREKELQEMYKNAAKETEEEVLALQQEIDKYCKEREIDSSKIMDDVAKCLKKVRERCLEKMYEEGAKETREEAIALQKKMQEYMQQRNMEGCVANDKIAKCIGDIDIALRTYKNVLYSSEEEKVLAESQDKEAADIVKDVDDSNYKELLDLIIKIEGKGYFPAIEESYTHPLHEKVDSLVNEEVKNVTGNLDELMPTELLNCKDKIKNLHYKNDFTEEIIKKIDVNIESWPSRFLCNMYQSRDIREKCRVFGLLTSYPTSGEINVACVDEFKQDVMLQVHNAYDGLGKEMCTRLKESESQNNNLGMMNDNMKMREMFSNNPFLYDIDKLLNHRKELVQEVLVENELEVPVAFYNPTSNDDFFVISNRRILLVQKNKSIEWSDVANIAVNKTMNSQELLFARNSCLMPENKDAQSIIKYHRDNPSGSNVFVLDLSRCDKNAMQLVEECLLKLKDQIIAINDKLGIDFINKAVKSQDRNGEWVYGGSIYDSENAMLEVIQNDQKAEELYVLCQKGEIAPEEAVAKIERMNCSALIQAFIDYEMVRKVKEHQWEKRCQGISGMSLEEVRIFKEQIREVQKDPLIAEYLKGCLKLADEREDCILAEEIKNISAGYLEMDIPSLDDLLEKLYQYPSHLSEKTISEVNTCKDQRLKEEQERVLAKYNEDLSEILLQLQSGELSDIIATEKKISEYDAPEDVKQPYYLKILNKKIEWKIQETKGILQDLQQTINNIQHMFSDEFGIVQNNEVLQKVYNITISNYSKYIEQWDIPILVYISNKVISKEFFFLYKSKLIMKGKGELQAVQLSKIASIEMSKKFMSMDVLITLENGKLIPLSNPFGKEIEKGVATLNDIINKLKNYSNTDFVPVQKDMNTLQEGDIKELTGVIQQNTSFSSKEIIDAMSPLFMSLTGLNFYARNEEDNGYKKIMLGAQKSYMDLQDDENIVYIADTSLMGNGKSGFTITTKRFYWKNGLLPKEKVEINSIQNFIVQEGEGDKKDKNLCIVYQGEKGEITCKIMSLIRFSDDTVNAILKWLNALVLYYKEKTM